MVIGEKKVLVAIVVYSEGDVGARAVQYNKCWGSNPELIEGDCELVDSKETGGLGGEQERQTGKLQVP